jgi:uncharacterized protein (TIGR00290 family)
MMKNLPTKPSPDFYWENGSVVFTAAYHVKRGYCCASGCRHCPYNFKRPNARPKVTVSWSGGKDSAFALHKIICEQRFDVSSLHTVIVEDTKTVDLHGIAETLIEKQAQAIGIPLQKIYARPGDPGFYRSALLAFYHKCFAEEVTGVVFGDIFLQDLRDYKENLLKDSGLVGHFPLWGLPGERILTELIDAGFKTKICAGRADYFSREQLGKIIDADFISTISPGADVCGENGEFHTFVYDGPTFRKPILVTNGDILEKTYLYSTMEPDGSIQELQTKFWILELLS